VALPYVLHACTCFYSTFGQSIVVSAVSHYGRQTFAVTGPTLFYSLNDDVRDPTLSADSFRRLHKNGFFQSTST